ncbi:MAG: alpha/beta hydrolase [Dongiaceae bacterium]
MSGRLELSGPSHGPSGGGAPDSIVVLLHGYGADGNDLLGLAPHWARLLPSTLFISPHAPFSCEAAPFGRQWFGFEDRDAGMLLAETRAAAAMLDAFIDATLAANGLGADKLALVGFSQGTMLALHVAPRRDRALAAVLGYSGSLIAPELLQQEKKSRPNILLVHGDADPVVPYQSLAAAVASLKAADIPVGSETRPRLAHAIDEVGLALGGQFLAAMLRPQPA